MRTFTLVSETEETLTSGFIPKPITVCFGENDEYQFEHKEYLVSIEKENVRFSNLDQSTSVPVQPDDISNKTKEMNVSKRSQSNSQISLRNSRFKFPQSLKNCNFDESESFIKPASNSISSNCFSIPNVSHDHSVTTIGTVSNNQSEDLESEELITPRSAELTKK